MNIIGKIVRYHWVIKNENSSGVKDFLNWLSCRQDSLYFYQYVKQHAPFSEP